MVAAGFIPIEARSGKTRQCLLEKSPVTETEARRCPERASIGMKPSAINGIEALGQLFRNVVLQLYHKHMCWLGRLRVSGCNTLPHSGLANVDTWKRMFYPLIIEQSREVAIFRQITVFLWKPIWRKRTQK